MIVVVDYGVGNSGSIANMLDYLGFDVCIAASSSELRKASHLILPGVGAFDPAMARLRASGMIPVLEDAVFGKGFRFLAFAWECSCSEGAARKARRPGSGG